MQETEQQFPIEPHSNNAGETKMEGLVSVGGTDTYEREQQKINNIGEEALLACLQSDFNSEWEIGRGEEKKGLV